MSATNETDPGAPIHRHKDDQVGDLSKAVEQAVTGAYLDWPNEAGFENLEEHRGPIELPVRGSIPSWAVGSLFRTGPGVSQVDDTPDGVHHVSHWFDGLAHTHRFDVVLDVDSDKTKVLYSSRRQCDKLVKHLQKNGSRDIITFAQKADPCIGIFGKLMSSWKVSRPQRESAKIENVAVTVQVNVPGLQSSAPDVGSGGHRSRQTAWIGTDANKLQEIDPKTLEPIGLATQKDLHRALDGPLSCAHAERCPVTGDYFNVNIKPGPIAVYRVFRVSAATGETEILAEFSRPSLPVAYIHSFFLSEHFVVLRVPSSHIKAYGLGILWERNIMDAIVPFSKDNKCKWFVVDRLGGRGVVAEFETEAGFFFHTVNCFEELAGSDDCSQVVDVLCDVVEYPTMDILDALYYDVMLNRAGKAGSFWGVEEKAVNALPRLTRWKFTITLTTAPQNIPRSLSLWEWPPLSWLNSIWPTTGSAETLLPERILNIPAPHAGELPTINPAYRTRPHRYVYSLSMSGRSTLVDTILKTDMSTQEVLQWRNLPGHTPGEAIFVARPGTNEEDDGVLLSVVLDGTCKKSYLLCLDAQTMCETGRAQLDFAVGFGFHGVHTKTDVSGGQKADP